MRAVVTSGSFGSLGSLIPSRAAPAAWRPATTLKWAAVNDRPYLGMGPQGLKAVVNDANARASARFFSSGLLPRTCGIPGAPPCDEGVPQASLSGFGYLGDVAPGALDLAYTWAKVAQLQAKATALSAVASAKAGANAPARWFWSTDDGNAMQGRVRMAAEGIARLSSGGDLGQRLTAGTLSPEAWTASFKVWQDTLNSIATDLKEEPLLITELFRTVTKTGGDVVNTFTPQPGTVDEALAWWGKNGKTVLIVGGVTAGVLGVAYVSGSIAAVVRALK